MCEDLSSQMNCQNLTVGGLENQSNSTSKWVVSPARSFKINAAVALVKDGWRWGCGAIIRDKATAFTVATATRGLVHLRRAYLMLRWRPTRNSWLTS